MTSRTLKNQKVEVRQLIAAGRLCRGAKNPAFLDRAIAEGMRFAPSSDVWTDAKGNTYDLDGDPLPSGPEKDAAEDREATDAAVAEAKQVALNTFVSLLKHCDAWRLDYAAIERTARVVAGPLTNRNPNEEP